MILRGQSASFLFLLSLSLITACERGTLPPASSQLLYPKKEDLYIRDGRSFTLAEYYSLQESFPTLSPPTLLRLAAFTQIAWKEGLKKNPSLSLVEVADLVRELLPPTPAVTDHATLEKSIQNRFNMGSRKEFLRWLEKSLTTENTLWNLPLLQEIHIEKPPWG